MSHVSSFVHSSLSISMYMYVRMCMCMISILTTKKKGCTWTWIIWTKCPFDTLLFQPELLFSWRENKFFKNESAYCHKYVNMRMSLQNFIYINNNLEVLYKQMNLSSNFSSLIKTLCNSLFTHTMIKKPCLQKEKDY